MAFIPVVNAARVVFDCSYLGSNVINTLHFQYTSDPTLDDLSELAVAMKGWWNAIIKTYVPAEFVLQRVIVTRLTDEPTIQAEEAANIVGTNATGDPTTGNVALVITFKTGKIGRSYRGRWYQAGIPTSSLEPADQNFVTVAVAAAFTDAFIDLGVWTFTLTHPPTHVIVSRYHNKAARSAGVCTPVTEYSCNAALDSQRRRLALLH